MFLASLDAIEVMLVTFSLSISIDMNDVTLVSEDTYGDDEDEEDGDDEDEEDGDDEEDEEDDRGEEGEEGEEDDEDDKIYLMIKVIKW